MKIIHEYALSHLKQNKRTSIFIFIAIMIASALICSMFVFTHYKWKHEVNSTIINIGNWHARLQEPIQADQLKYMKQNPDVETIQVQTQKQTLQLSNTKRPYLALIQLDSNSWKDMPNKNLLLEGRLPQKSDEVVVSKTFFTDNPGYNLGDTITVHTGERIWNGNKLSDDSPRMDGESFKQTGERVVTIVGTINKVTVSSYPSYSAFGFLDLNHAIPDQSYFVSARINHIFKSYELFPQLAENMGLKPDSNGEYKIQYNINLLALHGIKSPNYVNSLSSFLLFAILTVGLVMIVFVMIIYSAFSVSANSQIKQLGILKSIGATPKQIRNVVLYESVLLAAIAIPIGITVGYTSMVFMIDTIMSLINNNAELQISVPFSWLIVFITIIISLITVLISAWKPARKLAKMLSIDAIRNPSGMNTRYRAKNRRWMNICFGFEGELAANAFAANKKAFRTTLISLTMFITLILGFQCLFTIIKLDIQSSLDEKHYTLDSTISIIEDPDPKMMNELSNIPNVQVQMLYRTTKSSIIIDQSQFSPDFIESGGFNSEIFTVYDVQEGDHYRIHTELFGLDPISFAKYCEQIGVDPEEFKNTEERKGIIINKNRGNVKEIFEKEKLPVTDLLQLSIGDSLSFSENVTSETAYKGNYSIKVGAITRQEPELDNRIYPFTLAVIVPIETYEQIVQSFTPEQVLSYQRLYYNMYIPRDHLAEAQNQANLILSNYLPKEDWKSTSLLDNEKLNEQSARSMELMVNGLAIFIGLIAISGAFSSVSSNLIARKREFAVLRSTGLTLNGMNKLLYLESFFFSMLPIILSLPILIGTISIMLYQVTSVTFGMFITHVPWGYIALCILLIISIVWLAYQITGNKIKKENIITAIKDETI
jgi:putative ABC transport system permease protein